MNLNEGSATPERPTIKETGAVLLALGGVAAGFGAASCCALPLFLGSLGISSAWLFGIAILAAPHRLALIAGASLCLVGAAVVLALRRRAIACSAGLVCGHRAIVPIVFTLVGLGAGLAIVGYLYA
jgi:mercuric ion transport protein